MSGKLKNSFVIVNIQIARYSRLSPKAKSLYTYLRSFNPCFPSYARIIAESGIGSRSSVSKALRELEFHGFIQVVKKGRSNTYLFPFEDYKGSPSVQQKPYMSPQVSPKPIHALDSNQNKNQNKKGPEPTLEELKQLAAESGFEHSVESFLGISE